MLRATINVEGLRIDVVQVSAGGELRDDVLVTRFPSPEPFVRVAVFDPAENYSIPHPADRAHTAVAVARKWLRQFPDPIVALHGAAGELFRPDRRSDANPLTTVAWVDVRREGDRVQILSAGRCADSEVAVVNDGITRRLLTVGMLTPEADAAWAAEMARTRALVPSYRWGPRRWHERGQLLTPDTLVNPHLGQTQTPTPEFAEGSAIEAPVEQILVATDGIELDKALARHPVFDLEAQIAHLTSRTPPPGMPFPHGDIAAAQIRVA